MPLVPHAGAADHRLPRSRRPREQASVRPPAYAGPMSEQARLPRALGGGRRAARRRHRPHPADRPGRRGAAGRLLRAGLRRVEVLPLLRALPAAVRPGRAPLHPPRLRRPGRPGRHRRRRVHRHRALRPHRRGRGGRCPAAAGTRAEVAFLVQDAHQGRGVASALLEHIAAVARERGILHFTAEVLPANRKMVKVFTDAGYTQRRSFTDGVVHLDLDLEPTERVRAGHAGPRAPRRGPVGPAAAAAGVGRRGRRRPQARRRRPHAAAQHLGGRLHRAAVRGQPRLPRGRHRPRRRAGAPLGRPRSAHRSTSP